MDNKEALKNICRNIYYLRKKNHLSQKEMARLLHISVDYVRRLERGEVPPRMTVEPLVHCYYTFGFSLDMLSNIPIEEIEK